MVQHLFAGVSRTWLHVLAVLSVVGTCLAAASVVTLLSVGYHLLRDPKFAVDEAGDITTLIYIAIAVSLALTVGAAVFARGCYLSLRQIAAQEP